MLKRRVNVSLLPSGEAAASRAWRAIGVKLAYAAACGVVAAAHGSRHGGIRRLIRHAAYAGESGIAVAKAWRGRGRQSSTLSLRGGSGAAAAAHQCISGSLLAWRVRMLYRASRVSCGSALHRRSVNQHQHIIAMKRRRQQLARLAAKAAALYRRHGGGACAQSRVIVENGGGVRNGGMRGAYSWRCVMARGGIIGASPASSGARGAASGGA